MMQGGPPSSSRNRRGEILAEATRLFAERGYEGASMADLADRVGLRKASLFHHFPSKDALYAAVLESIFQRLGDVIVTSATTPGGGVIERLDRMTDALVDAMGEQPSAARLVVREMMDWGPFARERFDQTVLPVLRAAEEFLRAGQRDGSFPERDAKQTVLTMCGVHLLPFAVEHVVTSFTGGSAFSPEFLEARKKALRLEVRGLILGKSTP